MAPSVESDGFLTAFTVRSSFGEWVAVDQEMLDVRVAEVYALDRMSEFSTSEVFAAAVARAAEEKAKAVAHVVQDPVGTAKALPGGIARFAKGVGRSVKGAADTMLAAKRREGPRHQDERREGDGRRIGGRRSRPEPAHLEQAAGMGGEDRRRPVHLQRTARQEKLDDVAWAAYAGGFSYNVAMPVVPGLGLVETADQLVYQLPPGELQKQNDDALRAARVGDAARKALFVNRNFTPTLQTELAKAVTALGAATGTSEVVALAAESKTEGDARYIRRCVQLLAAGANEVGGWKALTTSGNGIEAVATDGRLVLPWAVDYMTWNAGTAPEESAPVKAATKREVWVTGVATARAKDELRARGFAVVEKRRPSSEGRGRPRDEAT